MLPFNKPYLTGNEQRYLAEVCDKVSFSGNGVFTHRAQKLLESITGAKKSLLTQSCTNALEMAAILLHVQQGDEIIMPSYTFVSTANAFVLRGAVPVFVDIREDTLNLDERLIEQAITSKTKAIIPVHYAGVSCEMNTILDIAHNNNLMVVEDAAQALMSKYDGKYLGTLGDLGTLSFHDTKNIISGEGGALLVNDNSMSTLAEIIREKGTNRHQFVSGEVDKYSWKEIGSSFLPSELTAAFLYAQLEYSQEITFQRIKIWNYYHELLISLEEDGFVRRQIIPSDCEHNAHMYFILLPPHVDRENLLVNLKERGVLCQSHYVPLHNSSAGKRFGKNSGPLSTTIDCSARIVRLPLWVGLSNEEQSRVVFELDSLLRA
jgi:dTDP-4-amino-4,6-dideoxygalactose transaminase